MEKTQFLSITTDDHESVVARAIVAREREIFSYELNIDNYEKMLAAGGLSPDFERHLNVLLVTENIERAKAVAVYESLKLQLPADRLGAAVAAAKTALPAM
jgi:hypothetical protein